MFGVITYSSCVTSTNLYVGPRSIRHRLQGAGGVGGLLAVIPGAQGFRPAYYPCYDANGNVTEYVDGNGVTAAHYAYDAYGNTTVKSGPMADDFNFRFSAKYFDAETGNYYYIKRHYSPALGRFISQDPIGISGGLNLYGFCGNDPVNAYDVLGLKTIRFLTGGKAPYKDINSAEDIEVIKSHNFGRGSLKNGETGPYLTFDKECNLEVHINIWVGMEEDDNQKYYYYREHILGNDQCLSTTPRGATIRHERGHARAYLQIVRPAMENYFKKFANHEGSFSEPEEEEIRKTHITFFKMQTHLLLSARYANEGTRGYFDGNPKFKRTYPFMALGIYFPELGTITLAEINGLLFTITDKWKRVK